MHRSNKLNAKKKKLWRLKEKVDDEMLMLLKLLQFNFSFTLKRSETTYCMLHCVIAILWSCLKRGTVNPLKSL